MNEYSKMKALNMNKSRSMDFADLSFFQIPPKKSNPISPSATPHTQEKTKIQTPLVEEEEEGEGQRFGVILSRNLSVSSASAPRFRSENQGNVQSVVRRAFSMRKSSSVGEGYCRIHDQSELLSPPHEDLNSQGRSGKKRLKILKACKKFFGSLAH